ncbi:MAG: CBU_0592 family membrane protein [Cyclobacteriaceae bacterium]
MTIADWIGSVGVSILLVAFLLNLLKKIAQDSLSYVVMNLIGALLAGLASWMINYTPFIILEAVWVLVSMMSLVSIMRRPSIK